jgi:hypothetical protein
MFYTESTKHHLRHYIVAVFKLHYYPTAVRYPAGGEIVVPPALFDDDLCLFQDIEHLPIKWLVRDAGIRGIAAAFPCDSSFWLGSAPRQSGRRLGDDLTQPMALQIRPQ